VRSKQERPHWGAPKIRELLARLYPFHDRAATVATCGRICFNRQKINLSMCSSARPSESNKPTIGFGSSALWTMISDTSTTRPAGSNPLQTLSGQKCYLCRRYKT